MTPAVFQFPASTYVPLGVAFFGLGTGYLIFGPQELLDYPKPSPAVNWSNGWWGIWMPGFCQLVNGAFILIGLSWFQVFHAAPLYAAGVITTVFGIHWLAVGAIRLRAGDLRPNGFMCIAFVLICILGLIVFADVGDWPVAVLFAGLSCVYFAEFFSSFGLFMPLSRKGLGFFHTITGFWLMYLTYAIVLNYSIGTHWPL